MSSNLLQRIGFVAVAVPLAIAIVYVGGWLLAGTLAAVGVLGAREVYALARHRDIEALVAPGLVAAALPALCAYWLVGSTTPPAPALAPAAVWALGVAAWLLVTLTWLLASRGPADRPLGAAGVTLFGAVYAGGLPAFLIPIRHAGHDTMSWAGTALVFLPLVVTWVCDTAAMFGGRAIGGPKLAPVVSPGKTRAGAIAGVAGGLLAVPVYSALVLRPMGWSLSWWQGLVFGGVLSVAAQVGDLLESLLKREAGVKDSSALIPGHGGVLDRFDSLYFAIPLATVLYLAMGIL